MKVLRVRCNIEDACGITNLLRDVKYSYLPTAGRSCYFTVDDSTSVTFVSILKKHNIPHEIEGRYNRPCIIDTPTE